MSLEFLTLQSTDELELPGLLYKPTKSTKKVALYLHGNGDSGVFYKSTLINAMGSKLTENGIAFLAFNNRGARYKKKLILSDSGKPGHEKKIEGGAHYELIEDCVKDIDGAILFLEKKGFSEFYIIGFSTGANKICIYDKLSTKNKVSRYIHAGPGDDSGLFYNEIGDKKFTMAMKYSKNAVNSSQPLKIMPKYTGMYPFSAQSALDILDPDGPYNSFPYFEATQKRLGIKVLFEEYKKIEKPMLVVFGEFDEFTYSGGGTQKVLELLKKNTNKNALDYSNFSIIGDTDHSFNGKEKELADIIVKWLK